MFPPDAELEDPSCRVTTRNHTCVRIRGEIEAVELGFGVDAQAGDERKPRTSTKVMPADPPAATLQGSPGYAHIEPD